MRLIDIKYNYDFLRGSIINIPNDRYNILSDGKNLAIYKRYLKIFYIRVSRIYEGLELQEAINEYNKLNNK
tara:strand:- start:1853 stop:2065 length:213 start_codon:yes stop_codon:yes gene_type:complete